MQRHDNACEWSLYLNHFLSKTNSRVASPRETAVGMLATIMNHPLPHPLLLIIIVNNIINNNRLILPQSPRGLLGVAVGEVVVVVRLRTADIQRAAVAVVEEEVAEALRRRLRSRLRCSRSDLWLRSPKSQRRR